VLVFQSTDLSSADGSATARVGGGGGAVDRLR